MAYYFYHYLSTSGRGRILGQKAASESECLRKLACASVYPDYILEIKMPWSDWTTRLSTRQLSMVFRELETALESGVPLLDALHYMAKEETSDRKRQFVRRLEEGVLTGNAFSEVLAKEKCVAPMLCQWIAIGEKQGQLAQVLGDIYSYLKDRERLKKQMQQQLLYPLIVLVAVLFLGAFLSLVVLPLLAEQFMGFDSAIPGVWRVFLVLHEVLVSYGWIVFGVILLAAAGFWWWLRRWADKKRCGHALKRLVLALPFMKKLVTLRVYVPFARLLSQMLCSGVPAGEALAALESYFKRSLFKEDVCKITHMMAHGGELSSAIASASFVPELAQQMLANGERYSKLAEAMADSADYYETVLLEELGLWLRFVEPLAVTLLGALVLFMALGLFVPVLESYQMLLQ